MSKEVGAGGRFDIFLDSVALQGRLEKIAEIMSYKLSPTNPLYCPITNEAIVSLLMKPLFHY